MDEDYKNEFFLKIKEFFESILITSEEFDQMSFRNLPIYIHIVNSNSYDEFKLRMELFDMETLNPDKYLNLKETYQVLKDTAYDEKESDSFSDSSDLETLLSIEKQKNECNDFYIMRLEDRLNYIFNQKEREISNLKNTVDEYYRIKENYKIIQKHNKELVKENSELKKGVFDKIRKHF